MTNRSLAEGPLPPAAAPGSPLSSVSAVSLFAGGRRLPRFGAAASGASAGFAAAALRAALARGLRPAAAVPRRRVSAGAGFGGAARLGSRRRFGVGVGLRRAAGAWASALLGRLGLGDRRLLVDRPFDHRRAVGLDRRSARRIRLAGLASAPPAAALRPAAALPRRLRSAPRRSSARLPRRALFGVGCGARRRDGRGRVRRGGGGGGGGPGGRLPRRRSSRSCVFASSSSASSSSSSSSSSSIVLVLARSAATGSGARRGDRARARAFDRHPGAFEALVDQRPRSTRRSAARSRPARRASC